MDTQPFDGLSYAHALPSKPGVYRMFDAHNHLLYVGKAKNLNKRVGSYFQKHHEDKRIAKMLSHVARMDVTVLSSEVDALILESRLIKSDKPKYNIALRDDRGYPYLHLSTDHDFPRLRVHFGEKNTQGTYFGPFPSSDAMQQTLDAVLRHFQLRTCSDSFFSNRSRPCLEYQIKRCSAPCVGYIPAEQYQESARKAALVLEGKSNELTKTLIEQMQQCSERMEYEQAAKLRDHIQALAKIQTKITVNTTQGDHDIFSVAKKYGLICMAVCHVRGGHVVGSKTIRLDGIDHDDEQLWSQFLVQYIQDPSRPLPHQLIVDWRDADDHMMELLNETAQQLSVNVAFSLASDKHHDVVRIARDSAVACAEAWRASTHLQTQRMNDLAGMLTLSSIPQRIECYDISHLQGQDTIGAMVVAGPQGAIKSAYRRYNIEGITPGDDYAAMEQVLTRRFSKPQHLPDLLLIDGGMGQVDKAMKVLKQYHLNIPVVGVSKGPQRKAGEETLVVGQTGEIIEPGPSSPALHLIQSIRDEAHRFAIEGQRKKRNKRMIQSTLLDIPGLGASKRQALLAVFGGINDIKNASTEELTKVPGIGPHLAKAIAKHFVK